VVREWVGAGGRNDSALYEHINNKKNKNQLKKRKKDYGLESGDRETSLKNYTRFNI
jgi:hypothetical protein